MEHLVLAVEFAGKMARKRNKPFFVSNNGFVSSTPDRGQWAVQCLPSGLALLADEPSVDLDADTVEMAVFA